MQQPRETESRQTSHAGFEHGPTTVKAESFAGAAVKIPEGVTDMLRHGAGLGTLRAL
jgi:hypothetical protein